MLVIPHNLTSVGRWDAIISNALLNYLSRHNYRPCGITRAGEPLKIAMVFDACTRTITTKLVTLQNLGSTLPTRIVFFQPSP